MTLADERYRAVLQAEQLLLDLTNPKVCPGIPKQIRERAIGVLRHYPSEWHMTVVADLAPEVFQVELEPLHKMILTYDQVDKNTGN